MSLTGTAAAFASGACSATDAFAAARGALRLGIGLGAGAAREGRVALRFVDCGGRGPVRTRVMRCEARYHVASVPAAGPRVRFSRGARAPRSEEHTSELQSRQYLVCRLLLE